VTLILLLLLLMTPLLYLLGLANAVQRERHHVGAVEDVPVPTTAGDGGDLASVEADGHLVGDLRLRRHGRFSDGATEVKPCEDTKGGGRSEFHHFTVTEKKEEGLFNYSDRHLNACQVNFRGFLDETQPP